MKSYEGFEGFNEKGLHAAVFYASFAPFPA